MLKNMSKNLIQIKLVDDFEKFEKIKNVKPNIIYNRFDIKFGNDFQLLEINFNNKTNYIAFFICDNTCFLGVTQIHITQSINSYRGLKTGIHWFLKLPDTFEKYNNLFSSKTRYNRNYYKKNLEKQYKCEWTHIKKEELTEALIEEFIKLKTEKMKSYYENVDLKNFLTNYFCITDTYTLRANNKLIAIIFYSIIDKSTGYCENMAYDTSFSKLNVGNLLYYYSLEKLIARGINNIYLGGGKYKYKQNSKAICSQTYSGDITYFNFWDKLFSIKKFCSGYTRNYQHYIIHFLGIKIKIRKTESFYKYLK